MSKFILQVLGYSPRVNSGLDKFNFETAKKLRLHNYETIFIYNDIIDNNSLIDELNKNQFKYETIRSKSTWNTFIDVLFIYIKYKPKIVHCHFSTTLKVITLVLSTIFRSKLYITFHSSLSNIDLFQYKKNKGILKYYLFKSYINTITFFSKNIFCVSEKIFNQVTFFSNSEKIKKLYLGVSINENHISKNEIRTKNNLEINKILICNVSAIEYIKGLDIIIDSICELKKKNKISNFKFYHIGDIRVNNEVNINFKNELINKIKIFNLEKEVELLGIKDNIDELMCAFDIYIQPSRTEGIPVSLMEASSKGLPLLGSNVGGIPEIIFNDYNGFIFNINQPSEFTHLLEFSINNTDKIKIMGNNSLKIANKYFNQHHQSLKLIEYYHVK